MNTQLLILKVEEKFFNYNHETIAINHLIIDFSLC